MTLTQQLEQEPSSQQGANVSVAERIISHARAAAHVGESVNVPGAVPVSAAETKKPQALTLSGREMGLGRIEVGGRFHLETTILAEMAAFAPHLVITLTDETDRPTKEIYVGLVYAGSPHTYLSLPFRSVAGAGDSWDNLLTLQQPKMMQQLEELSQSIDASSHQQWKVEPKKPVSDTHFPTQEAIETLNINAQISQDYDPAKIRLPLHFLSFVLVKDLDTNKVLPVDPLDLFERPLVEVQERFPELKSQTDLTWLRQTITKAMEVELNLADELILQAYNQLIMPEIAQAVWAFRQRHQDQVELEAIKAEFQISPVALRHYMNVGYTPAPLREKFDYGRGPASIQVMHGFVRLLLHKKLVAQIGHHDFTLHPDEYQQYLELIQAVNKHLRQKGITTNEQAFIQLFSLAEIGGRNLFDLVKMLDPYGAVEADLLMQPLTEKLKQVLSKVNDPAYDWSQSQVAENNVVPKPGVEGGQAKGVKLFFPKDDQGQIPKPSQVLNQVAPVLSEYYQLRNELLEGYQEFRQGKINTDQLTQKIKSQLDSIFTGENDQANEAKAKLTASIINAFAPTKKMEQSWQQPELAENPDYPVKLSQELRQGLTSRDLTEKEAVRLGTLGLIRLLMLGEIELNELGSLEEIGSRPLVSLGRAMVAINQGRHEKYTTTDVNSDLKFVYQYLGFLKAHHPALFSQAIRRFNTILYHQAVKIKPFLARQLETGDGKMNQPTIKSELAHQLIPVSVLYFLELERVGIRPSWRKPSNITAFPGFLITAKETGEGLEMFINIMGNERGSVELAKGVFIVRPPDHALV